MVMNFLLTYGTILYHQLLIRIMLKILIIQKISHSSNGTTSCCEWRDEHCALPLWEWKKYMVIFGEISHFTGSCFLSPKLYPWLQTLNFFKYKFCTLNYDLCYSLHPDIKFGTIFLITLYTINFEFSSKLIANLLTLVYKI